MVAARQEPHAPLRVLIVEDSEDDALLLLRELRRGGYQPEYERVETPEAMKEALADPGWDVIFSDYHMPHFAAPEALRMRREAGTEAPFIVVSGKVGEDIAVEMMKAGAHDYVMKDNLVRLCATVEHALQEAEERRERKRAQRKLRRREAILESVSFAAERFLGRAAGWEESIEEVLERLGSATGVSRVYIFENYIGEDGEVWATQRYEWVAGGVSSQMDNPLMEAIPYRAAGYGRWVELLSRGEPVHGHTREFPQEEQPELREQDILSIAVVPIFVEGGWWGFVGFDECCEEREWSAAEIDALKTAASILGAAVRRRRIEGELAQSEERYRAVMEQATDGIYLLDSGTRRILETNTTLQEMLGYSAAELRGMEVYDFVAHSRENVRSVIQRTLEERRRFVGERKYRRKDGSLVDVEVSVSVIFYGGKEVICTIVRDITERKRAEEKLRASEAELRALFEAMTDVIFVIDGEGRYLKIAPTNPSLLYKPPAEVLGKTVHEIFPAKQADEFLGNIRRTLETRRRVNFEYGLRIGHREMWFDCTISPMLEDSVIAIARDITERRKNEEALRQSERLYRAVIEQATENIFLVDVETRRIVESNPAFEKTLGYTEEELRRMTLYDIVAADRESIDANVRRVLEQKNPFVGQRKYRRKDGSLLDVEVSASTILFDGRETLCAVAHDVTERARAQRLLEERVATLSRLAASLTLDASMEDTLDAMAESVVSASTAVYCSVGLVDPETGLLRLEGSHGLPKGFKDGMEAVWQDERARSPTRSPTIEAIRARRSVLVRNMRQRILANPLYAPVHHFAREAPWDTVFIVPLVSRGRALGVINFGYLPDQEPGEDERVFLKAVADQAAVAVENARLFAEARGRAAIEERQRLARELHDSVSQALYGIALGAKTARALLERAPNQAADPLDYVLSLSEAGLAEMRALIFELRPESLEKEGLVAALEKQAAALRARHEIEVEAALCEEPEASLEAREAVYRIAQEALHNTVKHARANNVAIKMGCDSAGITLEVSDDGVGFDARADFPGHLGLRSMRERASRLGGALDVETSPGRGTRISARIPV